MEARTVEVKMETWETKLRELQTFYTLCYGCDADYALTLIRKDCLSLRRLDTLSPRR